MAKQYQLKDVAGIANAIYAFMGLLALTASFVGALAFWFFAWLQTPVVRKGLAAKMGKQDFPFIQRTGFAAAAFLVCMMIASGTQYSKPAQQAQAPTEQMPASEQHNQLPPGEPVATPAPTATPKPQVADKIIFPSKLSGLSQSEIKSILGSPTKTGTRNDWVENKYQVGGLKYSIVFADGKSSVIDYYFDKSSISLPFQSGSMSAFGLGEIQPKETSEATATFSDLPGFSGAVLFKSDDLDKIHSACFSTMPGGLGC